MTAAGTDLVLVDAVTGEITSLPLGVTVDSPTDQIAEAMYRLQALEDQLKQARNRLGAAVLDRMDKRAVYTYRDSDYKLEGTTKRPSVEYDAEGLFHALLEHVGGGRLDREAALDAVARDETYTARAAGIKRLESLGGPVADTILEYRTERPKTNRTVRVTPTSGVPR